MKWTHPDDPPADQRRVLGQAPTTALKREGGGDTNMKKKTALILVPKPQVTVPTQN